jgi:hypothetical protein
VTHPSDAGEITLGRLLRLGFVVVFACLLFLFLDTKHRTVGYQAVHGQGIPGSITVTKCDSHQLGTICTGDFISTDGKVQRRDVRVNGVEAMAARPLPAAVTGPDAQEAWTADGSPWLNPSVFQLSALIPLAVVLAMLWSFLTGGPRTWRAQSHALRAKYARDRAGAHQRQVRMGRVH